MPELLAMHEDFAVSYLEAIENATTEERAAALDRFGDYKAPDILSLNDEGTEAAIAISGPLSPNGPSPIARFFGFQGTAYREIVESAQLLVDDPAIHTVHLNMDTPGGFISGMDSARQAIEALTAAGKTVVAHNLGMIASAGYYLATAATRIDAAGPLAQTGSIGVIIAGLDVSKAMEKAGIKRVYIVSRHAPNKAPDLSTDEGVAQLQAEADATERVFIAKVAEGRSTTREDVIANFGKGGMLIAQDPDPSQPDAVSVGMIDSVTGGAAATDEPERGPSAGPTTFRDFPIVDQPWDSAAASRRVRNFLNAVVGPNERYRQAFFWYDSDNADNFGAYKLPFVDVVDGRLTAIWNGITAANGAMSGARGNRVDIPNADRPRVQAHIDRYRNKWQRQNENGAGSSGSSTKAAEGGGKTERTSKMDLITLKAEHPALYAEAVAVGQQLERERVDAHATLGEASGDMEYAIACIKDGTELTAAVNAKHMAAGMNKAAKAARAAESEDDIDPEVSDAAAHEAALAAAVANELGVEING